MISILQRKDVLSALHATDKPEAWRECNGIVGSHLTNQHSKASIGLFPKLLTKIKIMLFAGDQDLICNHIGMEALIEGLTWGNQTGFGVSFHNYIRLSCSSMFLQDAKAQGWSVNGTDAGTWTEARNLTYVKVNIKPSKLKPNF